MYGREQAKNCQPSCSALTAAVVAVVLAVACFSERLEFADWTISVPEGTRIVEYPDVPMEERTERIELVEDLVIGEREEDPNYVFYFTSYTPGAVDVDEQGHIYILDAGNHRIQVFDESGEFVHSMGREGEGPGELERPDEITVVGKRLLVADSGLAKIATWTLNGQHVRDLSVDFTRSFNQIAGMPDGSLVVSYDSRTVEGPRRRSVKRLSADLEELHLYATTPAPTPSIVTFPSGDRVATVSVMLESPAAEFAVTRGGNVYLSGAQEYQVLAFTSSGQWRWAARVASTPEMYKEDEIEKTLEFIHRNFPQVKRSDIDWPERHPMISYLRVDGHGHLCVFPYARDSGVEEGGQRPVDVFSSAGEMLFSGTIRRQWDAAKGNYVYMLEQNKETEE
ncbi:MAG: 6-bladed beta-propeller [Acidobacteriota bacterium]